MTLAGIELVYLVKDIGEKTSGYYASNIWGINRNSLLFKLHHPTKPDIMLMVSSIGMWITDKKIETIEPNKMLRRLRSDLLRAKLTKIEQIGTERIAYFTFTNFEKELTLIVEFFGDGNIILCNEERKILALLHSIDVRHRQLRVGLEYAPPPEDGLDVLNLTKESFRQLFSTSGIGKTIGRGLGLPKKYVEEIIRLSGIDPKKPSNEVTDGEFEALYEIITSTLSKVTQGPHDPSVIIEDDVHDAYPIRFSDDNLNAKKVDSFNEGLDIVFTEEILEKGKSLFSSPADKKIESLEKTLTEQKNAINVVLEKSKTIAEVANLLFTMTSAGQHDIRNEMITNSLKEKNAEIISEKGVPYMKINESKIQIDPDSSLPTIASKLFDESKKQKGAVKSIEKLMKKTESKLEKTIEKGEIAKGSVGFKEIRKKSWFERYRWFYTSDEILAVGGRDSSSNSAIIRKYLEKNDKVFHAEVHGSPFFLLKGEDEELLPLSLEEVAHATVCFSRAWQISAYGMSSFWVNPDQVKKGAPTGQSMAKGAFMINGTRNFIKVSSLKLAVGIFKQDEDYLLVCGPPEPIKKKCLCYAVIEPGGSTMSDVAKKIRAEFDKVNDNFKKIFLIDDYVRALPTGSSKVTETG
uniref:Putative RNA-binding eukaryotic snRNP-like protein n=1 Tax=uncultured marine thaumarchaeote KM3_82_B03 TaxID=1456302 RepID=A0A075HWK3_9ARCH|nr:putative RNA-binding eukaryotic snRNP-like protein [uncultured marine thaumarchaeote KM3_82_B03]